jgi:hypothetical protein
LTSPTIPDELEVTDSFIANDITLDLSVFFEVYEINLRLGFSMLPYTNPYEFDSLSMILSLLYPEFFETESDISVFFPNGFGNKGDGFYDGGIASNYAIAPFSFKPDGQADNVDTTIPKSELIIPGGGYQGHSNELVNGANVFWLLAKKMLFVKNNQGHIIYPSSQHVFSGISTLFPGEGYSIKTNREVDGVGVGLNHYHGLQYKTLGVSEEIQAVTPNEFQNFQNNTSIDMVAGWNTITFNRLNPQDCAHAFRTITDDIDIVKNYDGASYMPEFDFNGIGDLIPGEAYIIYLHYAVENFKFDIDPIDEEFDLPFANNPIEPNVL